MDQVQRPPASGDATRPVISTWWGELRALLALGWPLILAQIAQNALITTDVVMIGWLGGKYLAAATLANALFIGIQLLGVGITSAVAPMVAQAIGSGETGSVRRTVQQGLWVALALVVLLLPIVWNIGPIYIAIGQDPELTAMAEIFVHYAVWLFIPAFMIIVLRSFLSALGSTRVILVITLVGVVLNAVVDYALIFGNWGFPRLELAGAGIATTLVNVAMFLMMALYIALRPRFASYRIFAQLFRPDWAQFWTIWKVGGPIGLLLLAEVSLFTFAALLQGRLGSDEIAAHAVALQLISLAFMTPLGLSQATTVRVGIAYGAGDGAGVARAGWVALFATLAFMTTTALIFIAIPHMLVGLFLDAGNADNLRPLALAAQFLLVGALFQLADGAQVSMVGALRGLTDTRLPLIIALGGYWGIGFPVAWILGFHTEMRGVGIWFGLAAGLGAVALALTIRFGIRSRQVARLHPA